MARIYGNNRGNTLNGTASADYIYGAGGNDRINGGGGADNLYGNDGADVINGGAGNDILNGYAGNDVLIGGAGYDQLTGGTGADRFVFNSVTVDDRPGGEFIDHILDFSRAEGDRIDLRAIDANWRADGNQAFRVVSDFTHRPGELTWERRGDNMLVDMDVNGDGYGDLAFVLRGVTALRAADFLL